MSRLRWHLAQRLHHVSYHWMTVIFLLLLAAVLMEFGLKPRQAMVDQLNADVAQQSLQLTRLQNEAKTRKAPAADTLALPTLQQLNRNIINLHSIARQSGITLTTVSYQLNQEEQTCWRYSIAFDGNMTYVALRKFLATAFRQQPNLALDKLEIQREDVLSGQPHVLLQLSLYFALQPPRGAS